VQDKKNFYIFCFLDILILMLLVQLKFRPEYNTVDLIHKDGHRVHCFKVSYLEACKAIKIMNHTINRLNINFKW